MKIRCLIVDDEPLARRVLEKHAADVPYLEVAGQCGSALDAMNFLHEQQVALIRDWRRQVDAGEKKEADALVPQLLLSVNAIAAGLQTTG